MASNLFQPHFSVALNLQNVTAVGVPECLKKVGGCFYGKHKQNNWIICFATNKQNNAFVSTHVNVNRIVQKKARVRFE